MGLQQLINEAKPDDFEELLFWGRVSGITKDYYIAMGVTYTSQYEFPTKTFYFASSSDMVFKQFREINTQHKDEYDKISKPFSGDSALVYVKVEETQKKEEEQAQEEQKEVDPLEDTPEEDSQKDFVARSLIEEDRLLYTVLAIENDCNIVPHGAFRLTERHEVERNVSFRGLSKEDCFKLQKYSHFRNCQSDLKKKALLEDDAVFQPDFLDDVWTDQPQGAWSIQKDSSESTAIIRHNEWAGYTAYAKVGSQTFGGVYVGDGLKNTNLSFQL